MTDLSAPESPVIDLTKSEYTTTEMCNILEIDFDKFKRIRQKYNLKGRRYTCKTKMSVNAPNRKAVAYLYTKEQLIFLLESMAQ